MSDDTDDTRSRPRWRSWIMPIVYWLVAAAAVAGIMWQMERYTRLPNHRTWHALAKTINRAARPGDGLAFRPSWLSGYATDRNRFRRRFKREDIVDAARPGGRHTRVWVVHGFFRDRDRRPPPGYIELNLRRVGPLHVQLLERKAP